ncbi:MAG: putative ester cyclase [Edaphobacter sp.]|nr:putative ester cyclase [Edaphobacter sp.]
MTSSLKKPAALSAKEWEALNTFYAAIDQHDFRLLHDALAPDWADLPPEPGQAPGPEGVKPILKRLIDAFPDLQATMEEAIAEEHRAAIRVILSGTHLGSLLGIQPTGQRIVLSIHEFHEFVDGRIAVTRHMEGWMDLFAQLGSFPSNRPEPQIPA